MCDKKQCLTRGGARNSPTQGLGRGAKLGRSKGMLPRKKFIICRSKMASSSFLAANNRNS